MEEKITYSKNFLTKVLFRIDFSRVSSLENEPVSFRDAIQTSFPKIEPVRQSGLILRAELGKAPVTEQVSGTLWQFTSADGNIHCNILPESLVLESNTYQNFTTFSGILKEILDAFYSTQGSLKISRTGLRYINEIVIPGEGDYLNWEGYINPLIASPVRYKPADTELKRILTTGEFNVDAETMIILRTGIFNSSYPAGIIQKEFVLDLDCFSTRTPEDKDSLIATVVRLNGILTNTFESLIEEKLRTLLNKI